jgi:outer membrane protein OmpA-like peptidoglycan-associated protein
MRRLAFPAALVISLAGLSAVPAAAGQSEEGGSGIFRLQSAVIPQPERTYSFGYYGRLLNAPGTGPFNSLLENSEILDTAGEPGTTAHARLWAVKHTFAGAYSPNEKYEVHVALPFYTERLSYGPGYYTSAPFSLGDVRYGVKYRLPGLKKNPLPIPFTSAVLAGGSLPTARGNAPVPLGTENIVSDPSVAQGVSHADGTRAFGWHLGLAATSDLAQSRFQWPVVAHVNLGYRKNGADFYDVLSFGTGAEYGFAPRWSVKGEYWHENRVGGVDNAGIHSLDDISLGAEYLTKWGVTLLAGVAVDIGNGETSRVPFVDKDGYRTYDMNARSSADAQLIVAVTFSGRIPDRDRDHDGVPDKLDKCPDEPQGPNGKFGCPLRDRDRDGVPDDVDKCPDIPQGASGKDGCPPPDVDSDAVCDPWVSEAGLSAQFASVCAGLDRCPGVPGTIADSGCVPPPVLAVQQRTLILKGVNFETGKAVLLPTSLPILDSLAAQLREAEVVLEVSGHTDNQGKRQMNLKLSDARAKAVMDYLIKQGVPAERLTAKGYGPDKPIADNKTAAGRAENRRVEFNRRD